MALRVVLAAVTLALLMPACGGSGGDKAGGRSETSADPVAPVGEPVSLTLVGVDDTWATDFVAAASRLSGGTVQIRTQYGGNALVDYERRMVDLVRAGDADLASVGARAWDRMGVTSFRALVAPFLIDSLDLEERVLESPLVQGALHGVERLGLVGLAVLPGPLRRPFGRTRRLVGPRDYAGATIGIRYGGVAKETLRALGGTAKGYRIGSLGGLDGAELDVATIDYYHYDLGARALTTNVVLWARPETIVISRRAFQRLSPEQRDVLRRAGAEVVSPILHRLAKEERQTLAAVCGRGAISLVESSPADVAALRAAVQPVYDDLERHRATRRLIEEIRRLRVGHAPDTPACPAEGASAVSQLDGRWQASASRTELLAAGADPREVARPQTSWTLDLDGGRWSARSDGGRAWSGDYSVGGDVAHFTLRRCSLNPCDPGATAEERWSVYRDTLSLAPVSGQPSWWQLTAKPLTRVP